MNSQTTYNPALELSKGFNQEPNPYGLILNYDSGLEAQRDYAEEIRVARDKINEGQ